MSDADLRDLERRFRETGSVEDEAAWLHARVQAGELDAAKLGLAAYSSAPLGRCLDIEPAPSDLEEWARGLETWGQEPCLRAAVAASRAVLPHFLASRPADVRPASTLDAVESWLLDPSSEALQAVIGAHPGCMRAVREGGQSTMAAGSAAYAVGQCSAFVAQLEEPGAERSEPTETARMALNAAVQVFVVLGKGPDLEAGWGNDEEAWLACDPKVRNAVCAELVPWALGYRDPVRERVEARQREAAGG